MNSAAVAIYCEKVEVFVLLQLKLTQIQTLRLRIFDLKIQRLHGVPVF